MSHVHVPSSRITQLSADHLALMVGQHASSEIAVHRKNNALKKLTEEVQESREDAERNQEKARYLELDVIRIYGQLARARETLSKEFRKNADLQQSKKYVTCDKCLKDTMKDEFSDRCTSKEDGETVLPETRDIKMAQRRLPKTGVSFQEPKSIAQGRDENQRQHQVKEERRVGVSYEEHEVIIRQAMMMKSELTKLAQQNGQDVDKIMDAAEYEQIVKKLQQDIQEKADQNDVLLERIETLCANDSGEGSRTIELQFQNDKLSRRLNISQVMVDTLSKRCEELKDQVEQMKKQDANPVKKEDVKEKDQVDGHMPLPAGERSILQQQVKRLQREMELTCLQLKQVTANNKQLFIEQQGAERRREVFEERYNKLMETQRQRQCSNCRFLGQEQAKLKSEVDKLKEVNELVTAQMKLNEEDLRQEQLDMKNLKLKNTFHIEQWKRNCERMGQQVDLLTGDLQRERETRLKLQLHFNQLKQRPTMPMAASFSQSLSPRCGAEMQSCPWGPGLNTQLSSEVEVDGIGEDHHDGAETASTSPSSKTLSSSGNVGDSPTQPKRLSAGSKFYECPRCQREYQPDQEEDYHKHLGKCLDSS